MKNQLVDYGFTFKYILIFCENTNAITITHNLVLQTETKYIDIRYHFIRDHIQNGNIVLYFIPTDDKLADVFTKPLDESKFNKSMN